jgi:uncharacterized protein YndB with AHSA1/START domain
MGELRIVDEAVVAAPAAAVWSAIADPAEHARWHPFVTRITGEHRLGATRSCRVDLGRRKGETRERCISAEPERRIAWQIDEDSTGFLRLVTDWTAGFHLESQGSDWTRVVAESAFSPRTLLVRPVLPLVRRRFHATQRAILAALEDAVGEKGRARIDA